MTAYWYVLMRTVAPLKLMFNPTYHNEAMAQYFCRHKAASFPAQATPPYCRGCGLSYRLIGLSCSASEGEKLPFSGNNERKCS